MIEIPALIVDGELDVPDFRVIADRLARDLPLAERATIAGAHHLPSLERPEAFDRAVRPFLDRVTART
jgi:pimeloyl-ACP methyl ester carboxylesterase